MTMEDMFTQLAIQLGEKGFLGNSSGHDTYNSIGQNGSSFSVYNNGEPFVMLKTHLEGDRAEGLVEAISSFLGRRPFASSGKNDIHSDAVYHWNAEGVLSCE